LRKTEATKPFDLLSDLGEDFYAFVSQKNKRQKETILVRLAAGAICRLSLLVSLIFK
jgi:hypothetical protein